MAAHEAEKNISNTRVVSVELTSNTEDSKMQAMKRVEKHYHVNLTLIINHNKATIDFAKGAIDRLHGLLEGKEATWAKEEIARIHERVLYPDVKQISKQVERQIVELGDNPSEVIESDDE
jgi:deoxyxylulose-5-phosphate synthase